MKPLNKKKGGWLLLVVIVVVCLIVGVSVAFLPHVQYEIGNLYASGTVVSQNDTKAAEWYQRAAVGGLVDAQYKSL